MDETMTPTRREMRTRNTRELLTLAGISLMCLDGVLTTLVITLLGAQEVNPFMGYLIGVTNVGIAMSFKVIAGIALVIWVDQMIQSRNSRWTLTPLAFIVAVMFLVFVWSMNLIVLAT